MKVHVHLGPLVVWIGQKPIEGGTQNNGVPIKKQKSGNMQQIFTPPFT
jgi:hypothetical protein